MAAAGIVQHETMRLIVPAGSSSGISAWCRSARCCSRPPQPKTGMLDIPRRRASGLTLNRERCRGNAAQGLRWVSGRALRLENDG
jgi:hypothetical protein